MRGIAIPPELQAGRRQRPYFRVAGLDAPEAKYVAWVDIMGTDSIMRRSIPITANYLGKLHVSALEAWQQLRHPDRMTLYPVIDGVYVVTDSHQDLMAHLTHMLKSLALEFILTDDPLHHFMARGCIAFGPVWEGSALSETSFALRDNPDYTRNILLGPAVTQAHEGESAAAPYGVWVHETARAFGPAARHLSCTHWEWWHRQGDDESVAVARNLWLHLHAYLNWCTANSSRILYPEDRIERHRTIAGQYFAEFSET